MAKRVFGIAGSGEIKCIYHYGDDRVTASFRSYAKDGTDSVVVQVDPYIARGHLYTVDPCIAIQV